MMLDKDVAEIMARLHELEGANINGRLSQLEQSFAVFTLDFRRWVAGKHDIAERFAVFTEVENKLKQRMKKIEAFISNLAELSYKGGFYEPDKSSERKRIIELEKEIADKDKRISEFENTLNKLVGKKK